MGGKIEIRGKISGKQKTHIIKNRSKIFIASILGEIEMAMLFLSLLVVLASGSRAVFVDSVGCFILVDGLGSAIFFDNRRLCGIDVQLVDACLSGLNGHQKKSHSSR